MIKEALKALADLQITKVVITYDGSGDSGCIDTINAFFAAGEDANLPDNVEKDIETIAYDQLSRHYGGWEINEGSHGNLTIDVAKKTISFDHHERIMSEETSSMTKKLSD